MLKFKIHEGDVFYYEYVNSRDQNLVRDTFTVKNGKLVLLKEEYSWYGVGQEYLNISYEDGMVVVHVNGVIDELVIMGAFTVPQKIVVNGEEYPINWSGKRIAIRVIG